jgi:hypothetical protein
MRAIFVPLFFLGLIISVTALITFKRGDTMTTQKNTTPSSVAAPTPDAKATLRTETATFAMG